MAVVALIGAAMAGCGPEKGHDIGEMHNIDAGDSMLYYYGQMHALDYWKSAAYDSTMLTEESKKAYMEGFKKGLDIVENHDYEYGRGVAAGVKLATAMMRFEKRYGFDGSADDIYNGFATGMVSNTAVNEKETRKKFAEIHDRFRVVRNEKVSAEGIAHLRRCGARLKMERLGEFLWCRILTEGTGPKFVNGDVVDVEFEVTSDDGNDLGLAMPKVIQVGNKYGLQIVNDAILTMRSGERSQYATTAYALLGNNCEKYNLLPTDIVLFTIRTIGVKENKAIK